MATLAADPARFSRYSCLYLGAALAIALLLAPARSLATAPPIAATYFACTATTTVGVETCTGKYQIFQGSAPNPSAYISTLIGYLNTTAVAGTTATYLACTAQTTFGVQQCSGQYQIIQGAAPSPSSYISWLIGYAYTSAVSGTQPTYLACTLQTVLGVPKCSGQYQTIQGAAPSSGTYQSWFMGYVYPKVPVTTYTATPKYYIGNVIYVPPGPGSSIQYATGTNTGTTLSMTQSFSSNSSVGASEGTPPNSGTANANVSVTVGNVFGGSTTNSTDVELTLNTTARYQAPASNALDHDYDQIVLFFGVQVTESVDYYGNITWGVSFANLNNSNSAASGYPVAVGCLRANSSIPAAECADTQAFLASFGVTSADYPQIMNADPFANPGASQVPDPSRFVKLNSFSYYGDPTSVTYTYGVTNSTTVSNSTTTSYSYSVGFSGSLFGLKIGNTVTYTNSSTTSNKTMSTGTSTLSLTMPTPAYTGPTTLNVYEDTVYKTFMFSFN
jgi:hypothetical protein